MAIWEESLPKRGSTLGNVHKELIKLGLCHQWQYKNTSGTYVTGPTAVTKPTDVAQCSTALL